MRAFVFLLLVLLRVRTRTIHISLRFTCTKLEIRSIQKHFASSREAFCCWHWGGEEADRFRNGSLIPENRRKKIIHTSSLLRSSSAFLFSLTTCSSWLALFLDVSLPKSSAISDRDTFESQRHFQSYFADPLEILRKYNDR